MINRLVVPMTAKSKPRGQIGKYGNMTHSMGGYREWQKEFKQHIVSAGLKPIQGDVYSLLIDFHMAKKKGRRNDLDNMCGSVLDSLTKFEILKDDNWGVLPRMFSRATASPVSSIHIYFTETKKEMLYVLEKFF